jgi:hypothetical protein
MAIGLTTSQQAGKTMVEDVTGEVVVVDYASTPFYSMLAESEATNTLHQWLTDVYATSADNAAIEGSDMTYTDLTEPVRGTNVVQLFTKDIRVSDTARAVAHYGTGDPYAYQKTKKMVELARDIEKALVAGTRASGSSGVARRMDGAIALVTTNKTARNSGTSLSETEFNDIMEGIFTNGTDISVDKAFTGSSLKRAISGYTAGSTKFVDANGNKLYNSFSVYESDFGVVTVQLEREVPTTAGNKGILLVDSSKWNVAYLTGRRPQHKPLATIGDATRGMLAAELTLEARNEKSSAYRSGYV